VIRLDACRNQVVVGSRQEAFRREFCVKDIKWMASGPAEEAIRCRVKIRSTGAPLGPVVFENGVCHAEGGGLFGVAPGQSAVFYDDSGRIICGGVLG
jgi:tRNA-specific 2-thiouridylase